MKSTEETGMDFINKPDWAKIINIQNYFLNNSKESSVLARIEDVARLCVCLCERERGLKELMVKEAGFFPTACVFVCCVSVNIVVYVCAVSVG